MRKSNLNIPELLDGVAYLHKASDLAFDRYARYVAHEHDELEFNLGICGSARYLIDGMPCDIKPGVLLWLFPEQTHLITKASPDFSMWIVFIKASRLKEICAEAPFTDLLQANPGHILCTQLDNRNATYISDSAGRLLPREPAGLHNRLLQATVLTAYHAFVHSGEERQGGAVHPSVARATRLLQSEEYNVPLESIARKAGISKSQLCRLFKAQTGLSLVEYRHKYFLDRFMYVYGSGKTWTVLEAALQAGFGSYAQFYRVFAGHYGCGPHDYFKASSTAG